ncbi:MAG: hypothetical protein HY510_08370 [Acidobacteria bacterium]|nr:hypothetical protein [Acidobacteriota bacterium]
MRSPSRNTTLAALAALAVTLGAAGCNRVGDDPEIGEALILATAITTAGTSVAATTTDVTATITFSVEDRNGSSDPVFNSVTFTDFTVTYSPALAAPASGVTSSVSFLVGSVGNTMTVTLIPAALKAGLAAGTVILADIRFNGADLIGRAVTFDVSVAIGMTP